MIWGYFPMEGIFFLTCSAQCVQPALPVTAERHFLSNFSVASSLHTSHLQAKHATPTPAESAPSVCSDRELQRKTSSLRENESFLEKDPSSTYCHFFCNTVDYPTFIKHFHFIIAHPKSYVMHTHWDKIQMNFWITVPLIPLNVFLCYCLKWQPFTYWKHSAVDYVIIIFLFLSPIKELYSCMPLSFPTGVHFPTQRCCTWTCSMLWQM